jgi:hypothetical protein
MQVGQTQEVDLVVGREPYAWRSDEEDMVNALIGAAWRHHVSRRTRLKLFMLNLLTGVGALVRRG